MKEILLIEEVNMSIFIITGFMTGPGEVHPPVVRV